MTRRYCAGNVDSLDGMRVLKAALGLAVVAVVGGSLLVACDAGQRPDKAEPTRSASTLPDPSDGGAVRVRGVGFTAARSVHPTVRVSYGVVLENVSSRVADEVTVTVRILGTSGDPLEFADDDYMSTPDTEYQRTVRGLRPGEKLGLGGDPYLTPELGKHKPSDVSTVTVEVSRTAWWQQNKPYPRTRIEISDTKFERFGNTAKLNFTVESQCDYDFEELYMDMQAVFYGTTGKVVGGGLPSLTSDETSVPSGRSNQKGLTYMPEEAHVDRVEVYARGTCHEELYP